MNNPFTFNLERVKEGEREGGKEGRREKGERGGGGENGSRECGKGRERWEEGKRRESVFGRAERGSVEGEVGTGGGREAMRHTQQAMDVHLFTVKRSSAVSLSAAPTL